MNCSTDAAFLGVAKSNSELIEGTSTLYVGNQGAGIIKKFVVKYSAGNVSAGEPTIFRVYETSVDSNANNLFSEAVSLRNSIIDYFDGNVTVPNNVALSAWQLSGNSVFQRDIAIFYNENQTWTERVGNYTGVVLALGGKLVATNIVVTVKFGDGSIANFKISGIDYAGQVIFEFMNAIDSLGNPIPTSAQSLEGQFRMNDVTMSHYRNAAASFKFSLSAPNIQSGTVTITDCVVDPKTKEVTCKVKSEGGNIP